jgi:hypothetical protein
MGTITSERRQATEPDAVAGGRPWRRPLGAASVLLLAYVGLSFLLDDHGFLGTDTGGKVATVMMMSERGDFDPDIGYWASPWDPEADLHGMYYTSRIGDRYVNVTSLPMIMAARPLWDVGGYRATLLLPMIGAIATAFAARSLARRLGDGDGWDAYWIVGLGTPVVVYALDLWEHALGLALLAWAGVALVDGVTKRPSWGYGLFAGVAAGAAASMRTEAFVYTFAMVGVACLWLVFSQARDVVGALRLGAASVVGFLALFLANALVETAVLGEPERGDRATGAASAGLTDASVRIKEGLTTLLSPFPSMGARGWLLGGCLAVALMYGARKALVRGDGQSHRLAAIALVVVGSIYLVRVVEGFGFVPGLVATTPFAAVGLMLGWSDQRQRLALLLGAVPIPFVVAFQFTGGAVPQWGGRYLLASGLLLAVVGIVASRGLVEWFRVGVVVTSVVITGFGVLWLAERSEGVAEAAHTVDTFEEPVVVSSVHFWLRELAAVYPESRWLTANGPDDLDRAAAIVVEAGYDRFAHIDVDPGPPPPEIGEFVLESNRREVWLSSSFRVSTYVKA